MLLSITQEPLGALCHFKFFRKFASKLNQTSVDNFEIAHKTYSIAARGEDAVSPGDAVMVMR